MQGGMYLLLILKKAEWFIKGQHHMQVKKMFTVD